MRKRSAVADPAPTTQATPPSPPVVAPSHVPAGTERLPGNVELFQGMVFVRCLECGLNGNVDSAKKLPGDKLGCSRCGTDLDPDGGVLTSKYVQELKAMAKDAMGNPSPPPVDKGKCDLCGAKLTQTSAGWFFPCGHGRPEQNQIGPTVTTTVEKLSAPSPDVVVQPGKLPSEAVKEKPPAAYDPTTARFSAPAPVVKQDSSEDVKNREQRDRAHVAELKADRSANMQAAARGAPVTNVHNSYALGGDRVTVVYGEECYSPAQYQSFRVGPFTMETTVREGETPAEATNRAMAWLRGFAQAEFEQKVLRFSERLASFAKR